jgi:hypothetical protein
MLKYTDAKAGTPPRTFCKLALLSLQSEGVRACTRSTGQSNSRCPLGQSVCQRQITSYAAPACPVVPHRASCCLDSSKALSLTAPCIVAVLPVYLADYAYESAAPYNSAPSQQAYLPSPVAAGAGAAAGRAAYQPYNPHSEPLPVADAPYGGPAQRHGGYDPAPTAYTAAPARVQYTQPAPVASRHSRWSDRLMDPLDLNDGLLHNSVRTVALNTTALMMAPDRAAPASRRVSAATTMSAPRDSDMARYGPAADLSPSGSKRPRRDRSASPAPAVHAAGRSQSSTARRSRSPSASRAVRSAAEPVRKTSGLPFGARPPRPLSYATMPIAHLVADFNLPAVAVSTGADSVALRATDLYAKFPKLYLPNDLVSVCVDSGAALRALDGELYSNAINSVSTTAEILICVYPM